MEDKIDSFILREGIEGDKKFLLGVLNEIYDKFKKVNEFKVDLSGAKSFREAEKAGKSLVTTINDLKQSTDAMNKSLGDKSIGDNTTLIKKKSDAYSALVQQTKEAERAAKNAAAEFGAESEQALNAAKAAIELKNRLSEVNNVTKPNKSTTTTSVAAEDVPFTINTDVDTSKIDETTTAVNNLNIAQAEAANTATAWGDSQKVAGESTEKAASDFVHITSELDKYTGTLKENVTAQIENKNALAGIKKEQKELETEIQKSGGATSAQVERLTELAQESKLLEESNKALSVTIRNQVKDFSSAAGSMDALQAQTNLLQHAYEKLSDTERASPFGQELKAEIDKLEPKVKDLEGSIGKFSRNVGNYQGSAKIIVEALGSVEAKLEALRVKQAELKNFSAANPVGFKLGNQSSELNQVTAQIDSLEKEFHALNNITADPKFLNVASQAGDARKEIRGFTTTLIELEKQGLGGTDFANKLRGNLAQLTDQVSDTKAEIKALASDTRGFDLFAGSVNVAADAFQTAAGAAVLFGASEQDAAEATKTLVAIQSVSNGVKGIANELTTRGTAANKAYAFFETQKALALDRSAAASVRLAAATKLIGIGLALGAIAFIVIKMNEWAAAAKKAGAEQALLSEITNKAADSYGEEKSKLDVLIATIRTEGISRKQKFETLKQLQDAFPGYFDNIKTEADLNDKLSLAYEKATKGILLKAKAQAASSLLQEGYTKQLQAEQKYLDQVEALRAGTQETLAAGSTGDKIAYGEQVVKSFKNGLTNLKTAYDKETVEVKTKNERLLKTILSSNKEIDTLGGKVDGNKDTKTPKVKTDKSADDERKAAQELAKQRLQDEIKLRKDLSQSSLLGLNERVAMRQSALEKEGELAALERDFILKTDKATTSERIAAKEGFISKEKDLETDAANDIIKIRADFKEQEKKNADDNLAYRAELITAENDRQINANQSGFDKRVAQLEDQALKEEEINQKAFLADAITKEQYEEKKLAIENKFRRESLLAEIENAEKLLQIMTLSPEQIIEGEEKLAELKRKLRAEDLSDAEKAAGKRIEIEKKKNEALKELGKEVAETVFSLINNGFENEKNAVQDQIDLLEQRKQKEIEVATQTISSTEERAAAISVIEARANSEREQLERQKRQVAERQAKFEKMRAVAEIIANTASAIIKSVAASPLTGGMPFAAIAGAIGAAQLVRTLAAPIPKYKHGKNVHSLDTYEGPAWVDDGGKPEAIIRESGDIEIGTSKPRITYLKKNDIVLPDAKKLQEMRLRMAIDHTGKLVHGYKLPTAPSNANVVRAIDRLGNQFENAIKSIPQTVVANNIIKNIVRGKGSIDQLNNYR